MSHTTDGVVRHGAAQLFFRDFLVSDGLDYIRARDEHVTCVFYHENEVGDRGRIYGATRTGTHNCGDLRNHARSESISQENVRIAREARDSFLDASASGVVQANERVRPLSSQDP